MIHDVGITIIIHLGMVYTIIIYGDLGDGLHVYTYIYIWLVGGLEHGFYFSMYLEFTISN